MVPWNKGKKGVQIHSEKTRKQMSLSHLGGKMPIRSELWKKRQSESQKGKKHPPFTTEHRIRIANAQRGEKSHQWKGGISDINLRIRQSVEYKLWRESVFKRDQFTCVWCGDDTGGNLNADHIKSFKSFPELRFAIDNGRTLCVDCHKKTSNYGYKSRINNLN